MSRGYPLVVILLLAATAAAAQELAVFDLNDFVDPRELGAVPASFGRFGCPCSTVFVTRVTAGWAHDFMNISQATHSDVGFGQIAATAYRGPWQLNVKAAALRDVHRLDVHDNPGFFESLAFPRNFFAVQLGYYLRGPGKSSLRTQLSWRGTHYHETVPGQVTGSQRIPTTVREYFAQELGAEADTQVQIFGKSIAGSIIYTTLAQTPGSRVLHNRSRLAYVQRFPRFRLGAVRLDPSITAGLLGQGLKFSSAGRLDVQPKLRASIPLRRGDLDFVYGPSYERGANEWRAHREYALFVDVPVLIRSR